MALALPHLVRWLFRLSCAAVLALCGLIIVNALPYFSLRRDFTFLEEKGDLASDPVWRACFYGHVLGGIVCLASAPFLFWDRLRVRFPALHRGLGRLYGIVVLGWAGPAGLFLALHAKGGIAGRTAFLALGVLWWGATARGVQSILAKRPGEHRRWMIRSYSLALSAVSFRVFQFGLFWAGMADEPNYVLSLWLSLAASLAAGEALIRKPSVPLVLKGGVS